MRPILLIVFILLIVIFVRTRKTLPPYPSGNVIDLTDVDFHTTVYEQEFTFAPTTSIVFTVYNPNISVQTALVDGRISFVSDATIGGNLTNTDTITITNPNITSAPVQFIGPYGGGSDPFNQIYFDGNFSGLINGTIVTVNTTNTISYLKFVSLKSN